MNLPLSLLGRIATVKMKILPHINYFFSMLPITPTEKWFKSLDSLITHFYWKNKKAKIKLSTLQKNKSQGGLDAPNFSVYYLSNQIQYIAQWIHQTNHNASWADLEQHYCKNISLSDLPFLNTTIKQHPCFKNTIISTTLTAWWKVLNIFNFTPTPCKHTPIWHNPDFKLYNNTLHYHTWAQKGITHLHHLFHNNQFIDYKDLIQTYGIERHEFLKYLQLKSIIKSKMNTTHNPLESPKIIDDIIKLTDLKKLTSKLYKLILTIDKSIIIAITHWNKDLNISPSTDFWTEINQNIFTMTSNTNLQLIQYKIIHRTHITQYKMYKMGLANTDTCSQCTSGTPDNYFHALWACQPVHSFWGSVTQKLSTIHELQNPFIPTALPTRRHFSNVVKSEGKKAADTQDRV